MGFHWVIECWSECVAGFGHIIFTLRFPVYCVNAQSFFWVISKIQSVCTLCMYGSAFPSLKIKMEIINKHKCLVIIIMRKKVKLLGKSHEISFLVLTFDLINMIYQRFKFLFVCFLLQHINIFYAVTDFLSQFQTFIS